MQYQDYIENVDLNQETSEVYTSDVIEHMVQQELKRQASESYNRAMELL